MYAMMHTSVVHYLCGCRIVAITPAFQAGKGGSIPLTRSIRLRLRATPGWIRFQG